MHYGKGNESHVSGHGDYRDHQHRQEYHHEQPAPQARSVPQLNPLNNNNASRNMYPLGNSPRSDGGGVQNSRYSDENHRPVAGGGGGSYQGHYNNYEGQQENDNRDFQQQGDGALRPQFHHGGPGGPRHDHHQAAGRELIAAIQRRDCGLVERLLSTGIPMTTLVAQDPENLNRTPLHFAVSHQDADIIKAMVAAGCPVNEHFDEEGYTPLTLAMDVAGSSVELMIRSGQGRHLTRPDPVGRNLIHHLAGSRSNYRNFARLEMMQLLAEDYLVDPEATDHVDLTPLDLARSNYLHLEAADQGKGIIRWLKTPKTSTKALTALKMSKSRGMRFLLCHPWTRVICVLLLMVIHCIAYAIDEQGRDTIRLRGFVFVFHVFNMVGTSWPSDNTDLLGAKLTCILVGSIAGCLVAALVHFVLMQKLLRLRIFCGNGVTNPEDKTEWRGVLFLVFYGAFSGIFCGGLVYNVWLPIFPNDERYEGMNPDAGLTDLDTNKVFLGATLILDWFILLTIIDAMVQHGIARSHVPFVAYNQFWSCFHSSWKVIRYPFFYLFWLAPATVLIVILVKDWINYEEVLLTTNDAQKVATSGCCLLMVVVVMLQEWQLPGLAALPQSILLPGLPIGSNTGWLIWWCLSLVAVMDSHMLYRFLLDWINGPELSGSDALLSQRTAVASSPVAESVSNEVFSESLSSSVGSNRIAVSTQAGITWEDLPHLQRFEFAAALIPAFLAAMMLLIFLIRNMDRCCMSDRSSSSITPDDGHHTDMTDSEFTAIKKPPSNKRGGGLGRGGNHGADHPSPPRIVPFSASSAYSGANNHVAPAAKAKSDVWSASYNDDVIRLCALLDADGTLVNTRGGIGLSVDKKKRTVTLSPHVEGNKAATPLHYAIAGNAKSAVATLLSRGANPRVRTSHGMWTVREVAHLLGNDTLLDVL